MPPRRSGDATGIPKGPDSDDSPGLRRVNVGDPPVRTVGVGGVVEDPRLPEGGHHKPPRRRPLEGIEDRSDVFGEDFPALRPASLSVASLDNIVKSLVELLKADGVGVLVPDVALHTPESAQIKRLYEVGRVGDQKHHRDVFGFEKGAVLLNFVARAAVQNQHSPLVEGSKPLPQSLPFCLDVLDENVTQPSPKNITRDKAVCCRVDGEVFWVVPIFKKEGVDGDVFDDDGRCEARAVQHNAHHQRDPS